MENLIKTQSFDTIFIVLSLFGLILYRIFKGKVSNYSKNSDFIIEVKWDIKGNLEFETFIQIMKLSLKYGKLNFKPRRQELIQKRRQAFKDKDQDQYKKVSMAIVRLEQIHIQNVMLQNICKENKISTKEI